MDLVALSEKIAEPCGLLSQELTRWDRVHNLTGHQDPADIRKNLILDSLALVPHVRGNTLLDIGSGPGFPGLVLALALPEVEVTLLEARAKKVSFQKQAIRLLGLAPRVRAICGLAGQDLMDQRFGTVTLKAVSSIARSIELARPYLAPHGVALLPRAAKDSQEALSQGCTVTQYTVPGIENPRIIASYFCEIP